jgi:PST family polysaccharide transporter
MSRAAGRLEVGYLRALNVVTTGAAPVSAMMLAIGEPLVVVLLGEQWRGAGVTLAAMAGLGLGKAFQTVSEEAIKGAGQTKLLNWQTALELTLSVVLLLTLIRPLGIVGVGLSVSLTALTVGGVVVALALRAVEVSFRQVVRATGPPILCALLGLAVVAPLEHLVFHSDQRGTWVGIGLLLVDGLVFLVVYGASLVLVSPAAVRDLLRAVRPGRAGAVSGEPMAPEVGPSLDATMGEPSTPDRTRGPGGSG